MDRRGKKIFILLIVGIVLVVGLFIVGRANWFASRPSGVTITNAGDYTTWFAAKNIPDVEKAVYQRVIAYANPVASRYDATIRAGSLQTFHDTSYNADGAQVSVPTVFFVVDIPDAQESFEVSYSGGPGYPYSILHVLCPSKNEIIYGDFGCKDSEL